MPAIARKFRVHGTVQGVGFRWWTRSLAVRLGVQGTVRNLPDGSVELRARGEPEALDELRQELHVGPAGAAVSHVEESNDHADGAHQGFEIIH